MDTLVFTYDIYHKQTKVRFGQKKLLWIAALHIPVVVLCVHRFGQSKDSDWLMAVVWLSTWHRFQTWTNVLPSQMPAVQEDLGVDFLATATVGRRQHHCAKRKNDRTDLKSCVVVMVCGHPRPGRLLSIRLNTQQLVYLAGDSHAFLRFLANDWFITTHVNGWSIRVITFYHLLRVQESVHLIESYILYIQSLYLSLI